MTRQGSGLFQNGHGVCNRSVTCCLPVTLLQKAFLLRNIELLQVCELQTLSLFFSS